MKVPNLPGRGLRLNKLGTILGVIFMALVLGGVGWMNYNAFFNDNKREHEEEVRKARGANAHQLDKYKAPAGEEPDWRAPAFEPPQDKPKEERREETRQPVKSLSLQDQAKLRSAEKAWEKYYDAKIGLETKRQQSLFDGLNSPWEKADKGSGGDRSGGSTNVAYANADAGGSGQEPRQPPGRFAGSEDKIAWANRRPPSNTRYASGPRYGMASQYQIMEGTPIPAQTVGGIVSGVPIGVTALVTSDVRCAIPGGMSNETCIPLGTRLSIDYNTKYAQGECIVQAAATRAIYPDNSSMDLDNIPVGRPQGYAGMKDECHTHLGARLLNAVLFSAVDGAFSLGEAALGANQLSGRQVESVAQGEARQGISRPPTLEIRPAYDFIIRPGADMLFDAPYEPMTTLGE